jgi:hypothetical protein
VCSGDASWGRLTNFDLVVVLIVANVLQNDMTPDEIVLANGER